MEQNKDDQMIKEVVNTIVAKRWELRGMKYRKQMILKDLININSKIALKESEIRTLSDIPAILTLCVSCKKQAGIRPKNMYGKRECEDCRLITGFCPKCNENFNDCVCEGK